MVRTHLRLLSGVHSTRPKYRAIPTSLLTVSANLKDARTVQCYRSVLCEHVENPASAVRIFNQHVVGRDVFTMKAPHKCTLTLETVHDAIETSDVVVPHAIQKENGTTYLPLDHSLDPGTVIEVFQYWQASTFAELEHKSIVRPEHKPVYKIRVSQVAVNSTPHTPTTLYKATQRVVKLLDYLAYG